jgi:hypothetical protein
MAITEADKQIKWAAANTKSVAAGATDASDSETSSASEVMFAGVAKVDNAGTPAAGDTYDFYVLKTFGDPDADPDSADEYPSPSQREFLCQLDTNATDPCVGNVQFSLVGVQGYKFEVDSNAGTNSGTVSIGGQVISS